MTTGLAVRGKEPGRSPRLDYRSKGKPSAAVESLFQNSAKPVVIECQVAAQLAYLHGILEAVGPDRFDRMYPNGIHLAPGAGKDSAFQNLKCGCAASPGALKPGDWVYFHNNPAYPVNYPSGYWRGENAVVYGPDSYGGFGAGPFTEQQMNEELLRNYNESIQIKYGDYAAPADIRQIPGLYPLPQQKDPGLPAGCRITPVWSPDMDKIAASYN
jgi:hypothetical protein